MFSCIQFLLGMTPFMASIEATKQAFGAEAAAQRRRHRAARERKSSEGSGQRPRVDMGGKSAGHTIAYMVCCGFDWMAQKTLNYCVIFADPDKAQGAFDPVKGQPCVWQWTSLPLPPRATQSCCNFPVSAIYAQQNVSMRYC